MIFNLVSYRKLVPWGIVFLKSIIFINSRPTCGILTFCKKISLKKLPNQPRVKEDALNSAKKTSNSETVGPKKFLHGPPVNHIFSYAISLLNLHKIEQSEVKMTF